MEYTYHSINQLLSKLIEGINDPDDDNDYVELAGRVIDLTIGSHDSFAYKKLFPKEICDQIENLSRLGV
ncbi:MAG: hypothetical protein IPL20_03250 [Saprospiraceae bacterium]|nr:hypothetical protein [Saprospiraceae bacterium]